MPRPLSRYEKAERSLKRLRAGRHIGGVIYLLGILFWACDAVGTRFMPGKRHALEGPVWFWIGCALLMCYALVWILDAMTARRLSCAAGPEDVGAVALLLESPPAERWVPSRRQARLIASLIRVLPQLTPADLVYLDNAGASALYSWLTPPISLRAPGFVRGILAAIRNTQDGRALPHLVRYCGAAKWEDGEPALTREVAELRSLAEPWAAEELAQDSLLRPAEGPADMLLRPAGPSNDAPAEQLLRVADGAVSGTPRATEQEIDASSPC